VSQADRKRKRLTVDYLPDGVATWVGDSVRVEGTCEYYASFAKNGQLFALDDCVYVKPEERQQAILNRP
jgi:alpha-mannosidase